MSRIIKQAQDVEAWLEGRTKKEQRKVKATEAIKDVASDMLKKRIPILKAEKIQKKVNKKRDIKVSLKEVRQVLREALHLGWRTAKPIPI